MEDLSLPISPQTNWEVDTGSFLFFILVYVILILFLNIELMIYFLLVQHVVIVYD